MISPENDEEFGPFGESAPTLMNFLFPNEYKTIMIVSPSFSSLRGSNIAPQFDRGDFLILCPRGGSAEPGRPCSGVSRFSPSRDVDVILDRYRYEHAILASLDLSVRTAWAQAEYGRRCV